MKKKMKQVKWRESDGTKERRKKAGKKEIKKVRCERQ